jgi:hypothetical protein
MTIYNGLNTTIQQRVETRIKTIWQGEWSRLWMCVSHMIMSSLEQLLLHALSWKMHVVPYLGRLDQLWQHLLRYSHDKYIDLTLSVVGEKVENHFLYMCSILQSNSCNNMPKSIMGYNVFTLAQASKQVDTQIINSMSTLTTWKMCNYRMWQAKVGTYCCKEMNRKQTKCKCGRIG